MRQALVLVPLCALLAGCGGRGVSVASHKDLRTPLEKAAQAGDLAEVRRLLTSGSNPNDRFGLFGAPLYAAALSNHNAEVIRALIGAGANPNGRGLRGLEEGLNGIRTCYGSPLRYAASRGYLENVRTLLDSGASVQEVQKSPCMSKLVVGRLKPPLIDLLVQHGLDIFASDEFGRNELHWALQPPSVANFEGIEYLVHAGVPLGARDHTGKTPLAYWREPRDFETHWFRAWLNERLLGDAVVRRQRENRAKISALLECSGALL